MLWEPFCVSLSQSHKMNKWKLILSKPAGNRIKIGLLFLDNLGEWIKDVIGSKPHKTCLSHCSSNCIQNSNKKSTCNMC